jgi:hypothetical protein
MDKTIRSMRKIMCKLKTQSSISLEALRDEKYKTNITDYWQFSGRDLDRESHG